MTPQHTTVSVIDPISHAIERVGVILFKSFDLGKWFTIGFCAWLAYLGKGGFNFHGYSRPEYQPLQQAKTFIVDNLPWVILIGAIAAVVGIVLWAVITWLSSRGRFMFLHCVARNRAEVKIPWHKFRQHANSLFLFRIVLGIITFFATGLLCIPILFLIAVMAKSGIGLKAAPLAGVIMLSLIVFVLSIAFLLVCKFTTDFVIPIMLLRSTSCVVAWREFLTILLVNKARFALYILFQIVIGLAIGTIILVAALVTCCCAACLLGIPYIGTVLMLPLLVFKRAYSLCYFRQFGHRFDVFDTEIGTQH